MDEEMEGDEDEMDPEEMSEDEQDPMEDSEDSGEEDFDSEHSGSSDEDEDGDDQVVTLSDSESKSLHRANVLHSSALATM